MDNGRDVPVDRRRRQNVLETTVPRGACSIPAARRGARSPRSGIAHDGASFLDGDVPIYDLAFVGNESPARARGAGNAWQDRDQADILAGRYPSEHAVATVDFDRARRRRARDVIAETRDARVPHLPVPLRARPRWRHPAVAASTQSRALDEVRDARTTPSAPWKIHAGPYQPYGVWIPERLPRPAPLIVFLHGTGSNHLSNASRSFFGPGRFDVPAIVVEPLGRGGSCGYYGPAEQDVLDVMDDVMARSRSTKTASCSPASPRAGSPRSASVSCTPIGSRRWSRWSARARSCRRSR